MKARSRMNVPLFPETADANARRLVVARGLRALADGYVSILLPAYLLALGLDSFEVGVLATATLLGSASLTLCVGLITSRFGHRLPLLAAAGLMAATGLAFAAVHGFWPLLVVAFVGTLNPSSGDVSVFLPLEQSLLPQTVTARARTGLFARYGLVASLVGACGALSAGLPAFVARHSGLSAQTTLQGMFLLYALLALIAFFLYRTLSPAIEPGEKTPDAPLRESRKIVYTLAALFSLDSFGGGFVVQSLVALWLFERFHLSVATAGTIFFWSGVLSAFSFPVAAWL